jgi:hypothetical protein
VASERRRTALTAGGIRHRAPQGHRAAVRCNWADRAWQADRVRDAPGLQLAGRNGHRGAAGGGSSAWRGACTAAYALLIGVTAVSCANRPAKGVRESG